jgi:1-acyl-sn-glycerol-3-phosphate acyltransferase
MLFMLPNYICFLGKESLFKVPIIGWMLKYGDTIPIIRENITEAKHSLVVAEHRLAAGRHVAVAPEGTRRQKKSVVSLGAGNLLEFKKGPFHVAKHTGVRIIPVLVSGISRIQASDFGVNRGTVYINFLAPISSDFVKSDVTYEELRVHTQDLFHKNLKVRTDEEVLGRPGSNLKWIAIFYFAHALIIWRLFF